MTIKHNRHHCAVQKAEDVLHHYENFMSPSFKMLSQKATTASGMVCACVRVGGVLQAGFEFPGSQGWEQVFSCIHSNMNRPFKTDMVTY